MKLSTSLTATVAAILFFQVEAVVETDSNEPAPAGNSMLRRRTTTRRDETITSAEAQLQVALATTRMGSDEEESSMQLETEFFYRTFQETSLSLPTGPTASPTQQQNLQEIAICKKDPEGFYISSNDPRYIRPDAVEVTTSTTYGDASSTLDDITTILSGVSEVADSIAEVSEKFEFAAGLLGGSAIIASTALSILGPILGLESTEDMILNEIRMGFQMVNVRLNKIQRQIRQGFLEVSKFIGDVALDELAQELDSTGRLFNDYVLSGPTENRAAYHEPRFRAACNEAFKTPQDIFYDLYGYTCSNCTFASRKRADLVEVAVEQAGISDQNFLDQIGLFILRGMLNALFLHTICLPPIEGSCIDRSTDEVWQQGLTLMEQAYDETYTRIFDEVDRIGNWVRNIGVDDILPFVEGPFPPLQLFESENAPIAESIGEFLSDAQPDFDIEVIVADFAGAFNDFNVFRKGCSKNVIRNPCETDREGTGHFWFDNIGDSKSVSIIYRLKSLGLPPTTVTIGGEVLEFSDFYKGVLDKLAQDDNVQVSDFATPGCETYLPLPVLEPSNLYAGACDVLRCFNCDAESQAAFDGILGNFYVARDLPLTRSNLFNKFAFRSLDVTDRRTFEGSELFPGFTVDVGNPLGVLRGTSRQFRIWSYL